MPQGRLLSQYGRALMNAGNIRLYLKPHIYAMIVHNLTQTHIITQSWLELINMQQMTRVS